MLEISLCELKKSGVGVVLYGDGANAIGIYSFLISSGVCVQGVVDRRLSQGDLNSLGVQSLVLSELPLSSCFIITPFAEEIRSEIEVELLSKGFKNYGIVNLYEIDAFNLLNRIDVTPLGNNQNEEFEREYLQIKKGYKKIKIYKMWTGRVGEMAYRFRVMRKAFSEEQDVYHIVLSDTRVSKAVSNKRLLTIFSRYIHVVDEENCNLWKYIFQNHIEELDFSKYDYYDTYKAIDISLGIEEGSEIEFLDSEKKEAESKYNELGIENRFCCIFARDDRYLIETIENVDSSYHNYRNSSIATFSELVKKLSEECTSVVRVGSIVNQLYEDNNVYNLCNDNYDELLDLYVVSKCSMWIGTASGANVLPQLFGIKRFEVNILELISSCFTVSFSKNQICLIKLLYNEKKGRILTLYEMLEVLLEYPIYENNYMLLGLRIIDNTPQEILEGYMEAKERYSGAWIEDDEGKELQRKARAMCEEFVLKHEDVEIYYRPLKESVFPLIVPIATSFLKRNKSLVDI